MMCSKLLHSTPAEGAIVRSRSGFYHWIEAGYLWLLRYSLRFRVLVLLLSALVIAANVPLFKLVRQDYIPTNVDESEFEVGVTASEGASLLAMDQAMRRVEQELRDVSGVEFVMATVGTRGFGGVNRGDVYVRLKDIKQRSLSLERLVRAALAGDPLEAFRGNFTQREKMAEIRDRLNRLPDVRISVRNLTSLRQGAPVDIDFSITGPDVEQLAKYSNELMQRVKEIPGVVDVDTTLRLDKPELIVTIDRERAAALGVEVREIADTLRVAVGGDDRVSRYRDRSVDDAYDVELRLEGIDRRDVESISQLYVRANPRVLRLLPVSLSSPRIRNDVALTRIDNVVRFSYDQSAARIDRLDRQRMVSIRANLAAGYALADRIGEIQKAARQTSMPLGFDARVLGRGRELERTLAEFRWTFLLSFVFMYIVLAAQYEHLVHPCTILFSLPLAVPFGLISLYWGGETLNIYSALGILVLFGVVKKAAILQVDHTNVLRAQGLNRHDAIMRANRDRLRPILMTTISFVAGLLPLLIAAGPGAEERRSIAVLAVGGQTLSLLLTLLAVPVIYSYMDDIGQLCRRLYRRKA
jgi:HAE1 family hydrophobic/amphiphilic exporter-1